MKPIYYIALAALLFTTSTACDPTTRNVLWPKVATCGSQATGHIFDEVTSFLLDEGQPGESLTDQAQRGLEDLARDHGADVVACLVKEAIESFAARDADRMAAGYQPDPVRAAAAARGEAFLESKGVQVD